MPTYRLLLDTPVPRSHEEELAKRIFYVSQAIDSFTLLPEPSEPGRVTAVEVTTADSSDPADLARKLNLVSSREILPLRLSGAGPLWTSPHSPAPVGGVFDRLVAGGVVQETGPGLVATGEWFNRVMDGVDRRLKEIAESHGAVEYRYPTLIPVEVLHTGGYLTSFPQFVMSACRLHADVDTYTAFLEERPGDMAVRLMRFSEHVGHCLPPTMCFHTYHQMRGRALEFPETTVTSRGKSFRFEARYSRSLERLWDFTIRETVFFGSQESVAAKRQAFLEATCDLVTELGLAGHVEAANDPFFGGGETPRRVIAQRLHRLKYELRLPAEEGRTVAVGSFNVHGTTFGESFGITLPDGGFTHSACTGFGLERFAFALFCRYGAQERDWPADVLRSLTVRR
ncbi:hypothetical protein [Streptomyces sp. NPDC087300]|uniref:hypothetical protein n=1 Tax=Streptomyces sp. NPDC087300 TaxID=3365780 RepID=UPI00380B7EC9